MTWTMNYDGTWYEWTPSPLPPKTLYGAPLIRSSLIPSGLVMTLRNSKDETLVIRGEMIEGEIRFYHLTGEGGRWLLGWWGYAQWLHERYAFLDKAEER